MLKHLPLNEDEWSEEEIQESLSILKNTIIEIERHNFSCYILNGKGSTYNADKFFRCARSYFLANTGIKRQNGIFVEVDLIRYIKHELCESSLNTIVKNIHKDERYFSWKAIYYVLYHYEISLAEENGEKIYFETLRSKKWHLKKIYPNEAGISANFREIDEIVQNIAQGDIQKLNQERERFAYSLGNLFISLHGHQHNSFEGLKESISLRGQGGLFRNVTFMEREIVNYEQWTEKEIFERGKKIFSFLIVNWNLNNLDEMGDVHRYSEKTWNEILFG